MLEVTTRRSWTACIAVAVCMLAFAFAFAFASPAYADTADKAAAENEASQTVAGNNGENSATIAQDTQSASNAPVSEENSSDATQQPAAADPVPAVTPGTQTDGGNAVETPAANPVDPAADKQANQTPAQTEPKTQGTQVAKTTDPAPATKATNASKDTKPATATATTKASATKATATKTSTAKATAKTTATKTTAYQKGSTLTAQGGTGKGDLAAGNYYIVSAMNGSQVVDVSGASKSNGSSIIVWHVNAQKNEQWNVSINSAGYAIIKSLLSGRVLDISGASAKNGNHVIQWAAKKSGDSRNQQWIIRKNGSYYEIASRLNQNMVIDLTGNTAKDGTQVEIWQSNGGKNQLFAFIPVKPKQATAGKQTVKDGVYVITPKVATSRPVETTGGSKDDGANVAIYAKNNMASQAFYFKYDGKGFYTITNMASGKKLLPAAACAVSGINVAQYDAGSIDLAKWKVVSAGSGLYRLTNKATGTNMSIEGGKNANKVNVETRRTSNNNAQKFTLTKRALLPTGAVVISVGANTDLALDVYNSSTKAKAAIGTYKDSNMFNQRLFVSKQGKGYTLRPFNSRLYLTANDDNTLVQNTKQKNFANQIWTASETDDGFLMLTNTTTGTALTIAGTPSQAQSKINLKEGREAAAQKFFARAVKAISNGTYYIAAATASSITNQVIDVAGGKRINGTNVEMYKNNGGNNQKFNIKSVGGGYYKITSAATGRAIDVSSGSKKSGANVIMWSDSGATNQKWKIVFNSDFTMSFVSANNTKLRLDMAGNTSKNGTNVQVYTANDTNAQKFWLQQTTKNNNEIVQIGVPCYMQNPELPTGCESVALTNALRYWGFNLSKTEIADNWMPYGSDGVYDFTGNPRDSSGWIICAPGITNTANDYLKSHGSDVRAYNERGASLKSLRSYLDEGTPVIVWTSIGMATPNYSHSKHGYPICSNNHAVVLTGYNPTNNTYQVADSLAGTVWRNGSAFESIYNTMGKQAVILTN